MWLLKPLTNVQKLILPFIQIGLWIFLYEVLNRYLRKTGVFTPTRGVAWGISVEYYFFWYVIIVGLVNLAYLIFRKYYLIWLCLGLLGFFFVVSPTMYTYPYKTMFILGLAVIGFFIPVLILTMWSKVFDK